MAITLTGGATFVGGANIGTLPEPPPPVPPSEISLLNNPSFPNTGNIVVTDEGNGTFYLNGSSISTNGNQIAYASDVGKTSGKWYYFLMREPEAGTYTLANIAIIEDNGGTLTNRIGAFQGGSSFTTATPRVVYVDIDAKTYAIDDLSGTELFSNSWTGSGTFYFGLEFHKGNATVIPKARISFDPNFASATLRPGYSILAG